MLEVPGYPNLLAGEDGHLYYEGTLVSSWVYKRTGYVYTKLKDTPYKLLNTNLIVHRLVAAAYHPNEQALSDVNHVDGDKSNNVPSNLEWCSRRQNLHHAMRTGLHANPERAVVGWNPDTGEGVWFISQSEANRHGFTQANVAHVIYGRRAKCKGFIWEFA